MKRCLLPILLALLTVAGAWAQGYNDVRWPNYAVLGGTVGHSTNEVCDKMFDDNTGTKWCVTTLGNPTYVEFDASRPIKPTYYTLTTGGDTQRYNGRNPKSWVIKGSNDRSTWTTLVTVNDGGMPTGNCESKTFSMGNLGTYYRYWRFEVNTIVSGTVFQLSEFSFLVDYTNLKHVFVEGLEDTYYLAPGSTINPQITVRDLKGNTPQQGTYWKLGYYNSNNQYLSSIINIGNYTLVISQGSTTYYSDTYEAPITVAYGLGGSGTQSDPYTISSWNEWVRFLSSINAGKTYAGEYVSLLQDIDVEQNSAILPTTMADDDQSHVFCGTFLGNNHTITHTASYDKQVVGLFRWVKGATFKDLTVAGSISSSQKFMAAIVGDILDGDVTFDNCHVTATLNSSVSGDGTSAPFVGYQANGSVTFRNCSFTGSLVGQNTTLWSGMMGWGEGAVRATFSNCVFAPTTVNISGNNGATYARGRSGFSLTLGQGCYCTHQLTTQQGTLVYADPQTDISKVIHAADGKDYYMTCNVSGVNSEYTYYSGTPILPVPTVTAIDAETATAGTDYTLTYSDPTGRYPGQQTVTILAIGTKFVGSKTITYNVVRDPSLPELQPGDVNVDGFLTISDVTAIVNMARGQAATNQWADVDGDGSVTTADADLLVSNMLGKPLRITLSASTLSLRQGQTGQLTASFFPEGEYAQGFTWTTGDPAVATVDDSGRVTAAGSGTTTITATAYGLTATCAVSVIGADDYVDLGLPSGTLWATKNVGATQPKEYGQYFAWGETQPKETYTYTSANYTKAGITAITAADDAATVNWGPAWQMPTKAEMEELFNSAYTTCEAADMNGYKGFRITSKVNDNTLFLPAAGYCDSYQYPVNTNNSVVYWTSTLSSYTANAYYLYGNLNSTPNVDTDSRYYGRSVRPVLVEKAVRLTNIQLSQTTATIAVDEALQLTSTVLPANAETKTLVWTTSDATVATVSASGNVVGKGSGTCTITATTTDGSALSASCTVKVITQVDGYEYVDLGLPSGTLWATCNIGAASPEQSGLYFAWGETTGYAAGDGHPFKWSNYRYGNQIDDNFLINKYNIYQSNGTVDNLTELETSDDAAYVGWSTNWRMPSQTQVEELLNSSYTNAVWTTQNNVNGYLITSRMNGYIGNSIFLPAAGAYWDTNLWDPGEFGFYWSRSLNQKNSQSANYIVFSSGNIQWSLQTRSMGMTVRPVTVKE